MKENYFQKKVKQSLESDGFIVMNFADLFTGGIPDTYAAKDGISYWLELKVTNKNPGQTVHLDDRKSSERGFTREQAIKLYQLKEKGGVKAWGVIYLVHDKIALKIPPEDFNKSMKYEKLKQKYKEFIL
ncbi:MAG: hypothetical protein ACOCT9_00365 [archaeon]